MVRLPSALEYRKYRPGRNCPLGVFLRKRPGTRRRPAMATSVIRLDSRMVSRPFSGFGGDRRQPQLFVSKWVKLEPAVGFEPTSFALRKRRSTVELRGPGGTSECMRGRSPGKDSRGRREEERTGGRPQAGRTRV